jgi:hypothetical protein
MSKQYNFTRNPTSIPLVSMTSTSAYQSYLILISPFVDRSLAIIALSLYALLIIRNTLDTFVSRLSPASKMHMNPWTG